MPFCSQRRVGWITVGATESARTLLQVCSVAVRKGSICWQMGGHAMVSTLRHSFHWTKSPSSQYLAAAASPLWVVKLVAIDYEYASNTTVPHRAPLLICLAGFKLLQVVYFATVSTVRMPLLSSTILGIPHHGSKSTVSMPFRSSYLWSILYHST